MEKQLINKLKLTFDDIAHRTDDGTEYWLARELQPVLGYSQWQRFNETIERAKIACDTSNFNVSDHFADVGKMVIARGVHIWQNIRNARTGGTKQR